MAEKPFEVICNQKKKKFESSSLDLSRLKIIHNDGSKKFKSCEISISKSINRDWKKKEEKEKVPGKSPASSNFPHQPVSPPVSPPLSRSFFVRLCRRISFQRPVPFVLFRLPCSIPPSPSLRSTLRSFSLLSRPAINKRRWEGCVLRRQTRNDDFKGNGKSLEAAFLCPRVPLNAVEYPRFTGNALNASS